jgi:hypothetical protein
LQLKMSSSEGGVAAKEKQDGRPDSERRRRRKKHHMPRKRSIRYQGRVVTAALAKALDFMDRNDKTRTDIALWREASVGLENCDLLANSLRGNESLLRLELSDPSLVEQSGFRLICEAMRDNYTLQQLEFGTHKVDPVLRGKIHHYLNRNRELASLGEAGKGGDRFDWRGEYCGERGIYYFAIALSVRSFCCCACTIRFLNVVLFVQHNHSLLWLDLSNNNVGHRGAELLSAPIASHTSLLTVVLQNSCLGTEGAINLSNGLRKNKSITHLDLLSNHIGDTGLEAICSALADGSSGEHALCSLHLGDNEITTSGARALSRLICVDKQAERQERERERAEAKVRLLDKEQADGDDDDEQEEEEEYSNGDDDFDEDEEEGQDEGQEEEHDDYQEQPLPREAPLRIGNSQSLTALELRDNQLGPQGEQLLECNKSDNP